MTRWLETDSNTNIDISAATVIGSYTADADRLVVPQLLIDQVAGNGDYVYYAALQVNGSGSWYVIGPKTTHAAASGETAIGAQGGAVAMRSGDVLRVYVDGLAGDTSTPDTVVRFFEYQPAREAVGLASANLDTQIADVPTVAEFEARTIASASYATASALATVDGIVDDLLAVAPDNKPTVSAGGEASANVTYSAGVALSGRLAEYADLPSEPLDATATQAATAAALTAYDPPTKAELDAALLALVGADGDTLETLSDQIDAIDASGTAEAVWAYVPRTLTEGSTATTDATASGAITRKRGNSWSIPLTLGAITGYTSLWFTIKRSYDDADSAALLQIKLNSPSANDGLLYVNGAAATSAALGSITVSNAGTGAIVVAVDETVTDDLAPGTYYYDAQALISGAVTTPDDGTFTITADVTRSVA